ncbi:hypothetical protein Tco_1237554 [Tanacetum coccineum]
MAVLESCPKHNMVAYLEKTDGNAEFHKIVDFLSRSSIHNTLTVSPVVSTTFVEQFWMSTKSKIINNVRYITVKVAGKPVSISEASIRSDLLFDDADGIDSLPNRLYLMLFSSWYDSIPESSGGNQGGQSSSDRSLSGNGGGMTLQSAQIKKLKKKAKPVITHHRAWMKSVSLKQRLAGKKSLKKKWMQKESVSKQGRKSAKTKPIVHKDKGFDELDDDEIDNMETEDAQEMRRTRYVVHEEKERKEKEVSTKDALSTDKEKDSTDRPDEGTDKQKVSTDKEKDSTDRPDEGTVDQTEGRSATPATSTPTPTTFGDDETIAQVLLNMSQAKAVSREKEKGVELKDVENIERPRPTSTRSLLTLKPLPKIDPKDKGKKKIEEDESDTKSEDINETKKKFKMLAHDEEVARKMQED